MPTQDFGDYTVTTTDTPNGKTITTIPKPGTPAANRQDTIAKAQQALTANSAFLALASPTNPQVLLQVQRLTRETNALIRFLLDAFDDVSDT